MVVVSPGTTAMRKVLPELDDDFAKDLGQFVQ
jgi:FKBP-type peptidyl-prolyl cis-trans isomerase (trigger factor)